MKKYLGTFILIIAVVVSASGQTDTSSSGATDVFTRITHAVKNFRLDTSAAPDDKITRKINQLRALRGGFDIREAIEFKLAEDRQKNEMPAKDLDRLAEFFRNGDGKRWLDNAQAWIYRNHFSYKELRQLVKFYRTGAGQKLATDFPVVMLQSLRAAEMIRDMFLTPQQPSQRPG